MAPITNSDIDYWLLLRMDVKSIARYRCVVQSWDYMSKKRDFGKSHIEVSHNHNKFSLVFKTKKGVYMISDFNAAFKSNNIKLQVLKNPLSSSPTFLTNFCNGVVCFSDLDKRELICAWNPVLGSCKEIPKISDKDIPSRVSFGLGYDSLIDDFKLIRIDSFGEIHKSGIRIYTSKSYVWKTLKPIPYSCYKGKTGVLANNSLYWMASKDGFDTVILGFDVTEEIFTEVLPPSFNKLKGIMDIFSLNNSLCLTYKYEGGFEIWISRTVGNWSKLLVISQANLRESDSLKPLRILGEFKVLIEKNSSSLFVYDLNDKAATEVEVQGIGSWSEAVPFIECFRLAEF